MLDMLVLYCLPRQQREDALRQMAARLVNDGAAGDELPEWQARLAYLEDYMGRCAARSWASAPTAAPPMSLN